MGNKSVRTATLVFCVVIGLVVNPSSAWAAGSSDTGTTPWYATTYNGQIQCATGRNQLNINVLHGYTVTSTSSAQKDLFCLNQFPLPAGWMEANYSFQRFDDGGWFQVRTGSATNPGVNWQVQKLANGGTAAGKLYRLVTGHVVLLGSGLQQTIKLSTEIWG